MGGIPLQGRYRLVVYLRDHSGERTLLLDFDNLADLRTQVDRFERQRPASGAHPFRLYDFCNGRGDTIAFVEKLYQRHDIEEISASLLSKRR